MTDADQGLCRDVAALNQWAAGSFIEDLGLVLREVREGYALAELALAPRHLGANDYLHGGVSTAMADTACGWGCRASLPEAARGFVTIELKTSFLGTARSGDLIATATARHLGRRTQVWDAEVRSASAPSPIALFRCTQMVLG